MKKLLMSIVLILCSLPCAVSQNKGMSSAMKTYHDAGIMMLAGIDNGFDLHKLEEALDLFYEKDLSLDVIPFPNGFIKLVDAADTVRPKLFFLPDYAELLIQNKGLVSADEPSTLRKGVGDANVSVFHVGIKAHGAAQYCMKLQDWCELMAIAESGADVVLTVQDCASGDVYEGRAMDGGNVSWVGWDMSREGWVNVWIENRSDKDVSLAVATN